jgi:hypothetical protein
MLLWDTREPHLSKIYTKFRTQHGLSLELSTVAFCKLQTCRKKCHS